MVWASRRSQMSMAATRTLASWRTWSSSSPGATVDGPRHAGLAGRGHLPQRSRAQYTSRAFAEHCRALLRPLIAVRPSTPPPLRTALRTIDQHIGARFADARLPSAASTLDKSRSPGDQGSPARFRDVARNPVAPGGAADANLPGWPTGSASATAICSTASHDCVDGVVLNPVIDCKRGERKHEIAEEYLAEAHRWTVACS